MNAFAKERKDAFDALDSLRHATPNDVEDDIAVITWYIEHVEDEANRLRDVLNEATDIVSGVEKVLNDAEIPHRPTLAGRVALMLETTREAQRLVREALALLEQRSR
jgi:hypothetical protein